MTTCTLLRRARGEAEIFFVRNNDNGEEQQKHLQTTLAKSTSSLGGVHVLLPLANNRHIILVPTRQASATQVAEVGHCGADTIAH